MKNVIRFIISRFFGLEVHFIKIQKKIASISKLRTLNCQKCQFSSTPTKGRLHDKVGLITGGGSGIGRETCLLFAQHGAKVMVADINEKNAKETCEIINKQYGKAGKIADWVKMDVSKRETVEKGIAKAEQVFGKLNVLFNNAGIMHSDDDNAITTEDDVWDLTFNINVKGVFYGCKYGIPALKRAGGGSIINTASFVALRGAATPQLAYTSSKGAVLAMTRELAVVHARQNIRLNALCPGPIRTDLLMAFLKQKKKNNEDWCTCQWADLVRPRKWHKEWSFWLAMNLAI
ncbi:short-chain dehydrogenase/reductase SDR [Reticulomyxa filosa]|uniref:Short-chain dehydrogenase/reductase SDR n=1 Tax=Reticulomyxa filosa TaxID=46433 RepID=X6NXW3_RETFI|nr:short-chain dehydrogenase/reductase SDR [Reticulomyxa filosa]|eukprot:ETO30122.1 short-chain dehydrogenase/reductase SDR [Reticulomyxa filosa]